MHKFERDALDRVGEALFGADWAKETSAPQPEAVLATLQERYAALVEKGPGFAPGDVVEFKPGLSLLKDEAAYRPMVVVEDLRSNGRGELGRMVADSYFYERKDYLCFYLDTEGSSFLIAVDGRRLRPYSGPRLPE